MVRPILQGGNHVTEHIKPEQQSSQGGSISRGTFLKTGAATAGAALAITAGAGLAGATIKNEAHFNINGRAQAVITFAAWGGPYSINPFHLTMSKFMARHPAIKVDLSAIPQVGGWAGLFETIITR